MTQPLPPSIVSPRTLNKDECRALKEQMMSQIQFESSQKVNKVERSTQEKLASTAAQVRRFGAPDQEVQSPEREIQE